MFVRERYNCIPRLLCRLRSECQIVLHRSGVSHSQRGLGHNPREIGVPIPEVDVDKDVPCVYSKFSGSEEGTRRVEVFTDTEGRIVNPLIPGVLLYINLSFNLMSSLNNSSKSPLGERSFNTVVLRCPLPTSICLRLEFDSVIATGFSSLYFIVDDLRLVKTCGPVATR